MRIVGPNQSKFGQDLAEATELELVELFEELVDFHLTGELRLDSRVGKMEQELRSAVEGEVDALRRVEDEILFEMSRREHNRFVARVLGGDE